MSTQTAINLLRQYNKNDPYKKTQPIASKSDRSNMKIGTWSYANKYDALYDKYSQNKNFDIRMWRDAIKLGEEDQYLAFLEQNKDTVLSDKFYDPQYYDYEAMMMEMYLPFADNTKLEKYTQDRYDPASGKYVTEDLGEMTQRQYYQYLLDNTRIAQADEITKDLEQWRKDQLGFFGKLGHDTLATLSEFGEGILTALTGVIDFVGGLGYASYAGLSGIDNWADAYVEYFGELGLTALEKRTVRAALDEYERTHTHFKDINGNMTGIGKYVAGIANSIGMMIPSILLSIPTGGTSLAWLPSTTFYAAIFTGNMYENATNTDLKGPSGVKILNAAVKAGAEYVIEWGLAKFLGGTIQNQLLGIGGRNIGQSIIGGFTKTSGLKYFVKSAAQEGLEEFLQDFGTNCIDQFTDLIYEGYGNTGVTFQTLVDSFFIGALSSMFMSTGHIALNATTSAVQNKKMPGSGDLIIEQEKGKFEKITGFNKLYYSQILSDYKSAIDTLKKNKMSPTKNMELAQEVYGATSAIAQFYSSFDAERIKNCEMLLDRVVKAEQEAFTQTYGPSASALTADTITEITQNDKSVKKDIKKNAKIISRENAKSFAEYTEQVFRSMVGEASLRYAASLRSATDKVEDKLNKGGVKNVTGAIDADGIRYKQDPAIADVEEKLGKKAANTIDELRKGYEWLITTDGHVACETDGFLFVSEAWLQNYTPDEIYRYLEQTKVLDAIISMDHLKPMLKKLVAFDKEFTKQTDVTTESALMDFLFNESVFQAFLLSNAGENFHEFKNFIFKFHEQMQNMAESSKYHQQTFKGKQSQRRIALLNDIYDRIKEVMRKPTLKAILNWKIEPQLIGADSVLTPQDRAFVIKYKRHLETIANGGKNGTDRSAYENLVEDITPNGDFNDEELALIRKSRAGKATPDEDLEARALLDEADRRMTRFDFEVSADYSYYSTVVDYFSERLKSINFTKIPESYSEDTTDKTPYDVAIAQLTEIIDSINLYVNAIRRQANVPEKLRDRISFWYERSFESDLINTGAGVDLNLIAMSGVQLIRDYCTHIEKNNTNNPMKHRQEIGLGAFTIPYQALAIATDGDIAGAQFVADKLDEFQQTYGISARQMIMGDLTGMSMTQRNQLTQDMELFGTDSLVRFVIVKLESMLGDKYVVTPTYNQTKNAKTFGEFTIAPSLNFDTNPKDAREKLSAITLEINNWLRNLKKIIVNISQAKASDMVDDFFVVTSDISAGTSSILKEFLPEDVKNFSRELYKKYSSAKDDIEVLNWIISQEERLSQILYDINSNISVKDIDTRDANNLDSDIYDFAIAKSIPAEKILSADILKEDVDTRNDIFRDMVNPSLSNDTKIEILENILSDFENILTHPERLTPKYREATQEMDIEFIVAALKGYKARLEAGESPSILDDMLHYISEGVDPFTGEVHENDDIFDALYHRFTVKNFVEPRHLSDFIDTSLFPTIDLDDIRVVFRDAGPGVAGHYSSIFREIVIDPNKCSDYFGTLVHEINHALQDAFNLPNGFNTKTASAMPDFLAYVAKHYPHYVSYTMRRNGYNVLVSDLITTTEQDVNGFPPSMKNILAECGYMLVQGELWARAYMHNGKIVHGFTEIQKDGTLYLLAPDGKTKFKVRYNVDNASASIAPKAPKTPDSLVESFVNVLIMKDLQERQGYAFTSRDTFHSGLTKRDSLKLTQSIMNPALPTWERWSLSLDMVIRDAESYLSPEILAQCNGDFSEANVFHRVRAYVEENFEGTSIDINRNQTYIWVDDNAFDDILLDGVKNRRDYDEATIVKKYKPTDHIPLTDFYSQQELARLGINPSAYIVIAPNVNTETVFDERLSTGVIFIRANDNTTDRKLIDSLNHEFRHLLQSYNGFQTGFTPRFKVTREMIADVKKHAPEIFTDDRIIDWVKKRVKDGKLEEFIVQRFVYYLNAGELMAYAFDPNKLYGKPIFVNKEAGDPTIFMPWYDPKTGEGRHKTEYLAMRAEDTGVEPKPKKSPVAPRMEKRPKYDHAEVESLNDIDKVKYIYKQRRYFSKKDAEGTNLMYFYKKGERNQMDPALQGFIIDTTGHEDELPPELWNVIGGKRKGLLTKQALIEWFRKVDYKKVNQFTFDLLNKHFFKNDAIKNMAQLRTFLSKDVSYYWAAAIVLHEKNLSIDTFGIKNTVENFVSVMNSLEDSQWRKAIERKQIEFSGDMYSEKIEDYMRVLAMLYFDGSFSSAVYVATSVRKAMYKEYLRNNTVSLDAKRNNKKGEEGGSLGDTITEKQQIKATNDVGNDIIALYEQTSTDDFLDDIPVDDMINELVIALSDTLMPNGIENLSKAEMADAMTTILDYRKKLAELSFDEIAAKYRELQTAEYTDTPVDEDTFVATNKEYKQTRESIQNSIKNSAERILTYIDQGYIAFDALPEEVRDLFEEVSYTITRNGEKITRHYKLKDTAYKVGRGRKKLGRQKEITEGNEVFRHDVSGILANLNLLNEYKSAVREIVKTKKAQDAKDQRNLKRMVTRGEKTAQQLSEVIRTAGVPRKKGATKETEIKVNTKKKKRTSDVPNVFNIVSGVDMPYILHKIFDTSFEDLANTEVQFVSRDENGQLYDKEHFKKGEFDSRLKHEVSNWDAFYEANRETLINLSRNDVFDILKFFQSSMTTIDGPANKLAAFEIFILGYFVDAARHNLNNWDFSDSEIEILEKLYETKASQHGSGLNAVKQMLKVVNPYSKIKQRMFDEWDAISDDDKDELKKAVDEMQKEKNAEIQAEKAAQVLEMLKTFGKRQREADEGKYPRWSKEWWSRLGSQIKSWRYMAMLSGPATWVRNGISNVLVTVLNRSSDAIGRMIFTKKGYRKEQWNLTGTKVSNEAKAFIDAYILSNPVFDTLYDMQTKYDTRQNKKIADEKSLFVSLIAKAYERKYAQDNRFDKETLNNIAKFIDGRISDKKFVKFAAGRYFGKILTIEVERGKIDLSKGLSNEALNLFADAVILANEEYMHKRSFLADQIDNLRGDHPKIHELLTFWQPFLNSSFNWWTESFKYTPIGLANSIVRMCRLEKEIAKLDERRAKGEMVADSRTAEFLIRRDIGKGTVGLILSVLGIMLAGCGRLRIDEDDDKFYIFVDETVKLDITNLFGSSSVLMGAAIAQSWIKQSDGETATLEETLSMVTDTILEGLFAVDILERHKWGGTLDDLLTETEGVLRSFTPQLWQTIVACTNKQGIRYSPGIKGSFERWINSFVPSQPAGNRKINPYTGEIEDKYGLPIIGALLQKGMLLGTKIYWVEVSEIERMCRELGVNKNELTGELTVNGKKFELDRIALNKKYGELNKESLTKIKSQKHKVEMPDGKFKTLSWDKMSDKQRANVLSRTMTQNADNAKIYMWTQIMNKKYYASDSMWQILKRLGLARNIYKGDKGFVE